MRIALIGNSGTGKTTLAEKLAHYLGIPLVPEIARDLIGERNISDLRTVPPESMVDFQQTVLQRKLALENSYSSFVADRSTADSAVTWLMRLAGSVDPQLSLEFVEQCRRGMERYSRIFLLPSGSIPLEFDGIRQTNGARRLLFEAALIGLLSTWECPFHVIQSVSFDDRIAEICCRL